MIYKNNSLLKFKITYMMGVYCLSNFLGRQIYRHMSFDEYIYFPLLLCDWFASMLTTMNGENQPLHKI